MKTTAAKKFFKENNMNVDVIVNEKKEVTEIHHFGFHIVLLSNGCFRFEALMRSMKFKRYSEEASDEVLLKMMKDAVKIAGPKK